jgi:seryl-tRNA synthetase
MFVTRLHSDTDVYRAIVAQSESGEPMGGRLLASCEDVDYCLPPTMCFHTFHQFAGRTFGDAENRVVTAKGKSFRFESRYARSLERLWDFTIREIVFMGERNFVLDARERLMSDVFEFFDDMGLTGRCEVGNDPFFGTEDTAGRVMSQRLLRMKYELRADLDAGQSTAVASFNYHDLFFSESMGLRRGGGDPISTACAGFGLERLTYAFLCQHGLDTSAWPDPVRIRLESRRD